MAASSTAAAFVRRAPLKAFEKIPGPYSFPVVGTIPHYLPFLGKYKAERGHVAGMMKFKKFGKIVREEIIPGVHIVWLFDPDYVENAMRGTARNPCRRSHTLLEKYRRDKIQECPELYQSVGILPTNGLEWSKFRGQFQQSLSRDSIQEYAPRTDKIASELVGIIGDAENKGRLSQDFLPYLMASSLEVMIASLFGKRLNGLVSVETEGSLSRRLISASESVNTLTVKTDNSVLRLWRFYKTPVYRRVADGMDTLEATARDYIEARFRTKDQDLREDEKNSLLEKWRNSGVDIRDVVTMCTDAILAGIDTTSLSAGFALYHLAKNPRVQAELYESLEKMLPKWDDPITLEALGEMKYLKRVVKEAFRLHPISVGVGRIMPEDGAIGGYQIPEGTPIITMNQVISRMDEYFVRPNDFLPERWDPQRQTLKPHPFATMPFGYGPRQCIARRLAEQSLYIVLAKIIRRFHVEWTSDKELDCFTPTINIPDGPLTFKFIPRK